MASLSASGVGSGLDVNGIVSQLMALERRPLDNLNALGTKLNSQLSAYGQLKSGLSTFQTAMKSLSNSDKFQVFSATSSNNDTFTATADKTATVAKYSIEVLSLAKNHKLTSGMAGSPSYANDSVSIGGTGILEITQDLSGIPRTFQVSIDNSNNSLAGIRDAINNATNNSGVRASIVNTGSESKLVLSANNTGLSNEISIGAGSSSGIVTALGFETISGNSAADASIKIDGVVVFSPNNVNNTALKGVSLNIKSVGVVENINVARDTTAVKASVQKFTDAYNDIRKVIKTLGGSNATLDGESVLKGIDRKIQGIFNTSAVGLNIRHVSEIGIKTDPKTGDLSIDSTKLDAELTDSYSALADIFSHNTQGFAVRFESMAKDMVETNGLIDSRGESINSRIRDIGKRKSVVEYRLEQKERMFRSQFTLLDGLVSKLQTTGSFLTQQLARLPR